MYPSSIPLEFYSSLCTVTQGASGDMNVSLYYCAFAISSHSLNPFDSERQTCIDIIELSKTRQSAQRDGVQHEVVGGCTVTSQRG